MMQFVRGEIRQGDVALIRVEGEIPDGWTQSANDDGSVTLAHGEATGHHHSFGRLYRVALFRADDMALGGVLSVAEAATLVHQEHAPLTIPAGLYLQAVQVEETPEAIQVVVD